MVQILKVLNVVFSALRRVHSPKFEVSLCLTVPRFRLMSAFHRWPVFGETVNVLSRHLLRSNYCLKAAGCSLMISICDIIMLSYTVLAKKCVTFYMTTVTLSLIEESFRQISLQ